MRRVLAIAAAVLVVGVALGYGVQRLRHRGEVEDRFLAPPPSLPAGREVEGGILLVRDQHLLLRDPSDGREFVLKEAPQGSFYNHPRWSPDGSRIAYVVDIPFGSVGAANGNWGADVVVSDPDGGNEQVVRRRDGPGTSINGLAWTP